MADYTLIIKYLKIKALADRGERGERDNAAKLLAKLEANNPALKSQVAQFTRERDPPPDNLPPGVTAKYATAGGRGSANFWNSGNWENIFQYAQAAVSNAYSFAEKVAHAQQGAAVANLVGLRTYLSTKGNVLITFTIPPEVYERIVGLTEAQKVFLKAKLKEDLEAELTRLFGD